MGTDRVHPLQPDGVVGTFIILEIVLLRAGAKWGLREQATASATSGAAGDYRCWSSERLRRCFHLGNRVNLYRAISEPGKPVGSSREDLAEHSVHGLGAVLRVLAVAQRSAAVSARN